MPRNGDDIAVFGAEANHFSEPIPADRQNQLCYHVNLLMLLILLAQHGLMHETRRLLTANYCTAELPPLLLLVYLGNTLGFTQWPRSGDTSTAILRRPHGT